MTSTAKRHPVTDPATAPVTGHTVGRSRERSPEDQARLDAAIEETVAAFPPLDTETREAASRILSPVLRDADTA